MDDALAREGGRTAAKLGERPQAG